ncbi:MAG: GspE/PulE family protein [Candidatus Paceibacterota bacterium]
MDLLSFLQTQNVITPEQRQAVSADATSNADIERALLTAGVEKEALRTQIAAYYNIPAHTPDPDVRIAPDVLEYIPLESAQHYRVVPLKIEDGILLVGVNDPEDLRVKEVLSFVSSKYGIPYKFSFVLQDDLAALLKSYENLTGEVDEALTSLESELDGEITDQQSAEQMERLSSEHIKEDAPVTKIVATILRYAIDGGASDIHIEPTTKNVGVRFRVDGILQKSLELPRKMQSALVARVKILTSLRLDERRKPQDGRFSATFDGRKIDFRVSVLPTNHGEKIVMRILDNERGIASLEDTGISPHNLEIIKGMLNEPFGIILISGPTGSGKSTTLYTMLNAIDRQTKNVLSLEDPIEYNVDGVSQSQVRPEIGYTFANGLRSALRQDPDIILVGEIRDAETAQLAIQAALTGHLVLSTIHTNNAIGVVTRLVDMGIDPYLIAPTLKLAVAQRLSRRLCPDTGREEPIDESFKQMMEKEFATLPKQFRDRIPENRTIIHPEPSPGCASGMKGRIAVMETLVVTDEIRSLILRAAPESEIYTAARASGFMSMKEDAIIKALTKVIPYQEVNMYGTKIGIENATSREFLPSDVDVVEAAAPSEEPMKAVEPSAEPAPEAVEAQKAQLEIDGEL